MMMTDNKIEAKLDVFRKLQEGITSVGFKIHHSDIPDDLAAAALGKRYYLVLIDADYYDESEGDMSNNSSSLTVTEENQSNSIPLEKSDGEKLRIRACCLCKVGAFEDWIIELDTPGFSKYSGLVEEFCRDAICNYCDIKSRSELTTDIAAQEKFKELLGAFDKWKVGKKYSDNLERV